jgi:conjugal transfer pilus assembly protein TraI
MGTTPEIFDGLVRPVIRRFAAFVHLLPASEVHHHRGPGGLLQHSLEVAWLASQSSARHVFCYDRPPNEKYHIEPRWRIAAGIAGLLHDLGKPVADLSVGAIDGKLVWSPYREPLVDWLRRREMQRYYLHWRDTRMHNRHELMASQVVNLVLTDELLDYFSLDPEIHPAVLGVVTGTAKPTSLLASLVLEADQASVAQDLKEHRYDPNALSLGVPVDRYLVDAMRRLVKRGLWTCNTPGSRLWLLPDGLHVVWPQGGEEIIAELEGDNIPGIPKMHETIADILVDRGHVVSWQEGGRTRFYRKVAPGPLVRDGKPIHLSTLLLTTPDLVYPGHPPAPVGVWEEHTGGQGKARRLFDQPEPAAQSDDGERGGTAEAAAAVAVLPESGNAPSSSRRPSPSHRASVPTDIKALAPSHPDGEPNETSRSVPSDPDREPSAPQPSALSIADTDPPPASPDAIEPTASTAGTPVPAPATPAPPDAASVARAWLSKQEAAGQALIALGDAIHARALQREHVVHRDEGCLLAYPEALTDLTIDGCVPEPQALRQALWDAKLIAVDPMRPFLKSRNIEGRVWIVLVPQAGAALSDLLAEDAGGTCDVARSASDPKPAPAEQESRSVADTEADQARPRAAPQAPVSRSVFDTEPRPIGASRSPRAAS